MLTKEQIEKVRAAIKTLISADRALAANPCIGTAQQHDNAFLKVVRLTRKFGPRLCDMALAGLAVQPRPIEEFDEHNPPLGWFPVRDKDGRWEPAVWRDDGFYLFGGDAPLHPTHFLTALPTPAGRE